MSRPIIFRVHANPPEGETVIVEVSEGRHAAGTFEITAEGWGKLRERLRRVSGVRIVFYEL
jgi:hypothetical protein